MLVEFSVKNFRSVAEKQTISMATKGSRLTNVDKSNICFATGNSFAPVLLNSACLFGPNGAGKTTIVEAMEFFSYFTVNSSKNLTEDESIGVTSFKLSEKFREKPSEFEVIFIHAEKLYQYGFSLDQKRVYEEWLFVKENTPKSHIKTVFQRIYQPDQEEYVWDFNESQIKGEKNVWKNSTRDNALFLSTAVQLKSESLKAPYEWISRYFRVIDSPERFSKNITAMKSVEDDWKDDILNFIQSADVPIKDFEVDIKDVDFEKKSFEMFSSDMIEKIKDAIKGKKSYMVTTKHTSREGGLVDFDFDEESVGSQVIFSLAGPWLDTLRNGYTLVIDELHNSLHPKALRYLVGLFHDEKINKNNAQLIFTSHETSVMGSNCMGRDQIWFITKNKDTKSSILYPLSDFKPRDMDKFQKEYLDGRYGAIPHIQ